MLNYRILVIIVVLSFATLLWAGEKKKLTLEDIFQSNQFMTKGLNNARWLPDSKGYTFLEKKEEDSHQSIYFHNLKSGKVSRLVNGADLKPSPDKDPLRIEDYSWSKSGKKLLLKTDGQRVWRRVSLAKYFIYDLNTKNLQPVHSGEERISHPKLSADETMVGYVRNNNIYIKNQSDGSVTAVTRDGDENIINGQFDWVYEEEFGIEDGWRWSPDGKKIAFWRLDQSEVREFTWMDDYFPEYGVTTTIKYPKAGEKNSTVKIGIYHLSSQKTVWVDLGDEQDIYIPRIQWTDDPGILSVQRLNRLQNKLELMLVNAQDGSCRTILAEVNPAWVDVEDDLTFLKKTDQFIWTSERDGFKHIYLFDLNGKLLRQLTQGPWEVGSVLGVDEKNKKVFFSANREHVTQSHIYSIGLDGKNLQKLTKEEGSHQADFSPDYGAFIHIYSNLDTPPQYALVSSNGKRIRSLVENKIEALSEYDIRYPELLTFETEDGVTLQASMIKPPDFDPTKKYPVFIYGYGGPGSQMVRNGWSRNTIWHNLIAQNDYIIFSLDNRGTGGRGKEFKNLAYGDIGKYAVGDHIEAAKYLASLPYVDKERIGIWGWSGGGYLTMMALTKGSDYFKAGIAVASVSDFRLYDTIWSERYMGLPQTNAAGYDSASVLSYIDRYKGGLLIIHGMSDDNVHAQNSMQVIQKFQELNKPFELMLYPGKDHSMRGRGPGNVTPHLYGMMTKFILENL